MKDRRDESKAMSKKMYGHAYGAETKEWNIEVIIYITKLTTI